MKTLIVSICLMMTWQVALSQVDGTKSRDHFMRALIAALDANTDEVTAETLELESKCVAEALKVDTAFLDLVCPGLGKQWTDIFIRSHQLRLAGLRSEDRQESITKQVRANELAREWHEFFTPRKADIFKKLKINL
jgi:hypothetical protein